MKMISGLTILGWQAVAAILALTGLVDTWLAYIPDPAWLATVLAAVLSPPRWVVIAALAVAAALIPWAIYERRHGAGANNKSGASP